MSQLPNQTDLPTDAFSMKTPASTTTKSGLGPDQKKTLGIAAAALLLGGTAWAISKEIVNRSGPTGPDGTGPDTPENNTSAVTLRDDIDVAGKVTDTMSFEQAFGAAREEVGMGGVFSWHGRWHNTFEKEEWSDLSLEQRQEYTEMVTGENLPVRPYHSVVANAPNEPKQPASEPTAIEGHLNGQRVIGLDYNHDGIIDVLVMEGEDGNTFKVVDETGDDGLDTVYRYDALNGEMTAAVRLDHPFMLSNEQFGQALEESMSKEVVESILEPDTTATVLLASDETDDDDDMDDDDDNDNESPETEHEPDDLDDDTYTNDGDVQDMEA